MLFRSEINMEYIEDQYEEFAKKMEETYPLMFDSPYGGFAIGPGWWTIVEKLCFEIQSHINWANSTREKLLKENPHNQIIPDPVTQVKVQQIKEKFGGLRFYYDGGDQYIRGLTNFAEIWAENTCDQCGCPGHKGGTGWISTRCSIHRLKS